jgi:hypothetical protein
MARAPVSKTFVGGPSSSLAGAQTTILLGFPRSTSLLFLF